MACALLQVERPTSDLGGRELLLLTYRVKARNTAADSENKIHDDVVASGYGFKGGLVPGVAVYAYMTAPIVSKYGMKWLEGGTMQMRFLKPVYDGDEIVVRAETQNNEAMKEAVIRVERGDGSLCATGAASLGGGLKPLGEPRLEGFVDTPPPGADARPAACRESFVPGANLGTIVETIDLTDNSAVEAVQDRLTF